MVAMDNFELRRVGEAVSTTIRRPCHSAEANATSHRSVWVRTFLWAVRAITIVFLQRTGCRCPLELARIWPVLRPFTGPSTPGVCDRRYKSTDSVCFPDAWSEANYRDDHV